VGCEKISLLLADIFSRPIAQTTYKTPHARMIAAQIY
jgi:hypothetical protein